MEVHRCLRLILLRSFTVCATTTTLCFLITYVANTPTTAPPLSRASTLRLRGSEIEIVMASEMITTITKYIFLVLYTLACVGGVVGYMQIGLM